MALTTVRSPVTDIDQMSFGTTSVIIPSTGGPVNFVVTGLSVLDLTSSTAIDVDDLVTLTANNFNTETVTLATSGGAAGTVETEATLMKAGTSSAHPFELYANAITGLTIATTGKVELDVEGTAATHLVTKNYVDTTATAASVAIADQVATIATNGSIVVPNSTGSDLIINWGVTASIANTTTAVTFDTAFTSAAFMAQATRQIVSSGAEASAQAGSLTTTGMTVSQPGSASTPVQWMAFGF